MSNKVGKQTFLFDNVFIRSTFTIAGPLEYKGNFGEYYDLVLEDDIWGCKSHEKTEIKIRKHIIDGLLSKEGLSESEIDCIMGGDLLNQIVPTSFSAREFEIPFVGLYSACSTFGESLAVASMMIEGKFMDKIILSTSSHFGTAERQYRLPLELGSQPTPTSQWTVTGSGGLILTSEKSNIRVKSATIGKIVDLGINDPSNMGAAMAPSAMDTIVTHLKDKNIEPNYYDYIVTGDLGKYGSELLIYLADKEGVNLKDNLFDCGANIYSDKQKASQGGSGAGCSSLVFCSYLYKRLLSGDINRILLVPTGALLSKVSTLQGESIPSIAHAVEIERRE